MERTAPEHTVLFVDDETSVLAALRRLLRPMREEWSMRFAEGSYQALDMMEHESFDVIVTDMRMPDMDGSQLLAEVATRHPGVVRIALSGQSDQDALVRSISTTHQYLTKPCSSERLYETIRQAFALRDTIKSEPLRTLATGLRFLPSVPEICDQMKEELLSPDVTAHSAGIIAATDLAMSAKLLQIANSSAFGSSRQISSAIDAATCVGLEMMRHFAASTEVCAAYDGPSISGFSFDELRLQSLATARAAHAIATLEGWDDAMRGDALVAGLLHDIGTLVFAANMPVEYAEVIQRVNLRQSKFVDEERDILGAAHTDVGAYIVGIWGLGTEVVEAVAHHLDPAKIQSESFDLPSLVHVAAALARKCPGESPSPSAPTVDEDHIRRIGMIDRLPLWRVACEEVRAG